MLRAFSGSVLLAVGALGCGSELPPLPAESSVELETEPSGDLSAVSPVVRLRVASRAADPATLRLFREELSDYHVGRLRSGELPETLLEREVPMLAWGDEEGVSVRPLGLLEDGLYSLASPELGAIGAFRVNASAGWPLYERIWPPVGSAGKTAAYCGEPGALSELEIELEPQGPSAKLVPGLGSTRVLAGRCLTLELDAGVAEGLWLVPPAAGQTLLDPEPLFTTAPETSQTTDCAEIEVRLGSGCASVSDDSLALRAEQPLLWVFVTPTEAAVSTEAGEGARVGGLLPDREIHLSGETIDLAGERRPFEVMLRTLPPRPRVILNEVLANAKGSEPAMEWVEIVNAGSAPANLEGYRFEDSGGSVTLPPLELAPGAFALLVKQGFAPDPATDVPPLEGTPLLSLPSLGKSGLSNSGELLRLYDTTDTVVSQFPALKASDAGVSIARGTTDAPDLEASFGPHAAHGASPGAPNVLADGGD